MFREIAEASGRPFDVTDRMEDRIRNASQTFNAKTTKFRLAPGHNFKSTKTLGESLRINCCRGLRGGEL